VIWRFLSSRFEHAKSAQQAPAIMQIVVHDISILYPDEIHICYLRSPKAMCCWSRTADAVAGSIRRFDPAVEHLAVAGGAAVTTAPMLVLIYVE